eukprot:9228523-Lingulodinium_polyedra.AAC.1
MDARRRRRAARRQAGRAFAAPALNGPGPVQPAAPAPAESIQGPSAMVPAESLLEPAQGLTSVAIAT